MKVKGFTLVEIVVVVGALSVIMLAVTGIMVNSFRAKTRISIADVVEQGGSVTLSELKNNLISSVGVGMTCTSTDRLTLMNVKDGGVTTLICYEGVKIASESATTGNFDLTPPNLTVSGCATFVSCDLDPSSADTVRNVNFSFGLSIGNATAGNEQFVARNFRSSVVVRN